MNPHTSPTPSEQIPTASKDSPEHSPTAAQPSELFSNSHPVSSNDPIENVAAGAPHATEDATFNHRGDEVTTSELAVVAPDEVPLSISGPIADAALVPDDLSETPSAYDLREKASSSADRNETDDGTDESKPDIDQAIVADYFEREQLKVFADDTIRRATDLHSANHRDEMARYLKQHQVDDNSVVDHIVSELKRVNLGRPVAEIRRALRHFKKERKKAREAEILEAIFRPLSPAETAAAALGWKRLGSLFEGHSELAVPVIKHFMWQVGQKVLGRPVAHHLMAVIYSRSQGSGKTTFVSKLIGPMQELASDPVSLNEIADIRSGSIFEFPVIPVDDMEKMDPKKMATFKAAMTANAMRRRRLGTSSTVKLRQRATFIGTANHTADDLIMDDTGNRRFVTLTFRNGNMETGGADDVWKTVSHLDYLLLWRSVDAFKPSPLAPHLGALVAYQSRNSSAGRLRAWAVQLDLNSEAVLSITMREGIPSRQLWQLYGDQTGSDVSETWFSKTLSQLSSDPMVPFGDKYSTGKVRVWPIKLDHRPSGGSA